MCRIVEFKARTEQIGLAHNVKFIFIFIRGIKTVFKSLTNVLIISVQGQSGDQGATGPSGPSGARVSTGASRTKQSMSTVNFSACRC